MNKERKEMDLQIELISIANKRIKNNYEAISQDAKISKVIKEELHVTKRCAKVMIKYLWLNKTLNVKKYLRWSLEVINKAAAKGLIMYY